MEADLLKKEISLLKQFMSTNLVHGSILYNELTNTVQSAERRLPSLRQEGQGNSLWMLKVKPLQGKERSGNEIVRISSAALLGYILYIHLNI